MYENTQIKNRATNTRAQCSLEGSGYRGFASLSGVEVRVFPLPRCCNFIFLFHFGGRSVGISDSTASSLQRALDLAYQLLSSFCQVCYTVTIRDVVKRKLTRPFNNNFRTAVRHAHLFP